MDVKYLDPLVPRHEGHNCVVGVIKKGQNAGSLIFEGDSVSSDNTDVIVLFHICPICGGDLVNHIKRREVSERLHF